MDYDAPNLWITGGHMKKLSMMETSSSSIDDVVILW